MLYFRSSLKHEKFITAILAVLYLGTSSGATIHMHYCMGKLAEWGLGHQNPKPAVTAAWKNPIKR
ncbi:MAG: hypothetical protein IPL54_15650 [Chitinophagaceae bacterium]|nr:hypothetical protein [Chitinophagaceae bacterium]